MHTSSYSLSIFQIAESAYPVPETTRPWVVVTTLGNPGEEAHIETSCYDSGKEVAHSLSTNRSPILTIQCFTVVAGEWLLRSIQEVLIGTLGEAAVVVFRDDSGFAFCPDAPEQAVSQLSDLILCGVVAGEQPVDRRAKSESYGRTLHRAIKQEVRLREVHQLEGTSASARR